MKNKITKEDLYKNLDIINQWINNSDNKAAIILGLVGILLSICVCIFGLYTLIKVLIPTLKMKTYRTKSYMFFGSIASYFSFNEYKEGLLKSTEEDILDDLLNQVYQNSIICNEKFVNFSKGIKYFLGGFVSMLILYCIGILVYL